MQDSMQRCIFAWLEMGRNKKERGEEGEKEETEIEKD